jgi:hypothetical protein
VGTWRCTSFHPRTISPTGADPRDCSNRTDTEQMSMTGGAYVSPVAEMTIREWPETHRVTVRLLGRGP